MTIAVLLSGGVDSSLALALLRREGHAVTAFYLKIWLEDELSFLGSCPWEEDLRYARAVCAQAGVLLEVVPLQQDYREAVVEHALAELRAGRTPSPDILCNSRVKFGAFLDRLAPGFDKAASGHYARVREEAGVFHLLRSPDPVKDQTYFLHRLDQAQLARALFPIGHLTKAEVRAQARALDLPTAARKDSQGICFLGKISYREFVRAHLGERGGDIVEAATGRVLGRHDGCWFHTIGQRHGLGLGGGPWFVTGKDMDANTVFVARDADGRAGRAVDRFRVSRLHWISGPPEDPARLLARVRHGPELTACRLEAAGGDAAEVVLATPDPGIAPGQSAVFYAGERCLGGGMIA